MPAWYFGNQLLLLLIFIYFYCGIVFAKLGENLKKGGEIE